MSEDNVVEQLISSTKREDKAKKSQLITPARNLRLQVCSNKAIVNLEMLESRQESSEKHESVNQRIDSLNKAIKQQEGMIDRSKRLR